MDTSAVLGIPYRTRVIDEALQEALQTAGAVVVEGPRACGKTMTALHAADSFVFLDDPIVEQQLEIAAASLLDGAPPRLLDEWQLAPELWNLVRRAVDRSAEPGRFILTGSAAPADDVTRHSGAGRFLRLRQRTLAWCERTDALQGPVSLTSLIAGQSVETDSHSIGFEEVTRRLVASGFPAMQGLSPQRQRRSLDAYLTEIARTDVRGIAEVRHDPSVIRRLIAALARSSASPVTFGVLAADTAAVAPGIKDTTVAAYVTLLERLFVVDRQSAWTPQLRSRARLRSKDKLHLAEPSLAAVALGADARRLSGDPETAGLLFESAVFHDLSVLAERVGGEIRHYRDSNGRELDAVLVLPDGRWAAIEVKLGAGRIVSAAQSVAAAVAAIDIEAVGAPMFRLIVTGTGTTFTLDDGTVTVPLHRLGP
ncbi:ATP-binding protein [Nakamurella lactea]|uniref:ATP-binding protein n=1 Tax=Nakamurella lactea TaxID=459515 RepID=UPI000410A4B6|nr:DUF4143 domain-containing protein [Nakamurella lactea]